jgi:hypothetical protein
MPDTAVISRTLLLRPAEAGGIAGLWHRGLDETSVGSRHVRAAAGLWLASDLVSVELDPLLGLRRASGILWVRCRPVRIAFAVDAWSETETVVSIAPRALPSVVRTERYAAAASAALEVVANGLMQTNATVVARTARRSRSVAEIMRDRKFEWPARARRDAVPFEPGPRPLPGPVRIDAARTGPVRINGARINAVRIDAQRMGVGSR